MPGSHHLVLGSVERTAQKKRKYTSPNSVNSLKAKTRMIIDFHLQDLNTRLLLKILLLHIEKIHNPLNFSSWHVNLVERGAIISLNYSKLPW